MSVKKKVAEIMDEGAKFCIEAAEESENESHIATFSTGAMIIQSLASIVHLLPKKGEGELGETNNLSGRLFALETIAAEMGWEDSAYYFFEKLGLAKEFPNHDFNKQEKCKYQK